METITRVNVFCGANVERDPQSGEYGVASGFFRNPDSAELAGWAIPAFKNGWVVYSGAEELADYFDHIRGQKEVRVIGGLARVCVGTVVALAASRLDISRVVVPISAIRYSSDDRKEFNNQPEVRGSRKDLVAHGVEFLGPLYLDEIDRSKIEFV